MGSEEEKEKEKEKEDKKGCSRCLVNSVVMLLFM